MSVKKVSKTDVIFDGEVIVLRSVFDKAGIKYVIQPCKDRYGKYPPCIKKVDSDGNMILSESERNAYAEGRAAFYGEDHYFELTSGKTYHLNDMWEAAEWEAIKNCPLIAKSRDEKDKNGNLIIDGTNAKGKVAGRNGVAELYIDRPGLETRRRVSKRELKHQAESFIMNDSLGDDGQRKMARILGKDMSSMPIDDVKDFLYRQAEANPQKIIDLYTGGDTNLRLLLIEAREKRVIYIKNKLYLYADNIVLGATDDAVIAWMKDPKNQKTLELIRRDTFPDYYPEEKED